MKLKLLYIQVNPSAQQELHQQINTLKQFTTELCCVDSVESITPALRSESIDLLFFGINKEEAKTQELLDLLAPWPNAPQCILLANSEQLQAERLPLAALQFPLFPLESFTSKELVEILSPIAKRKERETKLLLHEGRLKNLEKAEHLYLIRLDKEAKYTYANQSYRETFLGPDEDCIGENSLDRIIPEDHRIAQEAIYKALSNTGQVFSASLRKHGYHDGEITRSNWEFLALEDEEGEFTELQCIGYEAKEGNKVALSTVKAEQDLALKNSDSLSILLDKDLTIEAVNGPVSLLDSDIKPKVEGQLFTDFILSKDLAKWESFFQKQITAKQKKEPLKIRLQDSIGRVFWASIMLQSVFAESEKTPSRFLLSLKEVKQESQAEKEKEALLVQTLEALEDLKSFQKALDGHALVAITDANGDFLYVNNFFAQTSGYAVSELIGNSIDLLQSSFHSKDFYQDIWETIKSGAVWQGEQRNKRKDRSYFWAKTTISPRFDENSGEIINYINILTDISSQKSTEKELIHSQNKLYNTLNSINQELWSVNKKYELSIFNSIFQRNFKEFFEVDLQHGLSMLKIEALPKDLRQRYKDRYDRAFKGEIHIYYDSYFEPKEQKEKHLEVRVLPTIDENDRISGATVYSQDITDRKEQENELKELLIRFELATKSNNIGIWDFDLRANKIIWDENMYALYEMHEQIGIDWDEWTKKLEPESLKRVLKEFDKALEGSASFDTTFKIIAKDGYKSIATLARIIRNNKGEAVRAIGLNWDITQTVEYEENLEESLKEKEDILNSISDGFLVLNKKLEVVSINKSACAVLDIKPKEVMGKSLWPADNDKEASEFYNVFKNAFETQTSAKVEGIDRISKNWIDATVYPNENGLVIFFKDVTIEKMKSMELEKVRNNQAALINTTDDLIWSLNTTLELVAFNHQFSQHQLKMGALMPMEGRIIFNQHLDDYKNSWRKRYEKALAGNVIKETIMEESISYSLAIYPIINAENETEGIACYARDISDMESYLLAIEMQNNELKDIAWMQSHIVRAPVARILGLVELIHDEKLDQDHALRGYLNSINVSAQELDSIIEKISEKTHSAKIKGI